MDVVSADHIRAPYTCRYTAMKCVKTHMCTDRPVSSTFMRVARTHAYHMLTRACGQAVYNHHERFTDDVSRVSCPIVDGSAASWSATPGVMLAVPWANSFQHGFLDLLPRLHSMIKVVPPSLPRHMSVIAEENLWTQLAVARSNTGMELHIHIFVD